MYEKVVHFHFYHIGTGQFMPVTACMFSGVHVYERGSNGDSVFAGPPSLSWREVVSLTWQERIRETWQQATRERKAPLSTLTVNRLTITIIFSIFLPIHVARWYKRPLSSSISHTHTLLAAVIYISPPSPSLCCLSLVVLCSDSWMQPVCFPFSSPFPSLLRDPLPVSVTPEREGGGVVLRPAEWGRPFDECRLDGCGCRRRRWGQRWDGGWQKRKDLFVSGVWLLRVVQSAPPHLGCVSLMAACLCTCAYASRIEQLLHESRLTVKMNDVRWMLMNVLFLCVCLSQNKVAYAVCFEWSKPVNDPLNFLCVCFRGLCMEDVWKARLDSVDEKEKGSSVVCSGCSTTMLPAERCLCSRWVANYDGKNLDLQVPICRNKNQKVSVFVPSVAVWKCMTNSIYASFMNAFTFVFPNTWPRISLARDKIFWLRHREGGVVHVWQQQQQFIWNKLKLMCSLDELYKPL